MGNVRVVLNMKGVRAVLGDDKVRADLERRARAIAAAANQKAAAAAATDGRYAKAKYYPSAEHHDRSHDMAVAHVWSNKPGSLLQEKEDALVSSLDAGR